MSEEKAQPTLTIHHVSYTRGELEGKPCVVVFDEATEKTTIIGFKSRGYAEALMALAIIEQASVPLPKSLRSPKTILHKPETPRLILPGSSVKN